MLSKNMKTVATAVLVCTETGYIYPLTDAAQGCPTDERVLADQTLIPFTPGMGKTGSLPLTVQIILRESERQRVAADVDDLLPF